MIKIKDDRVIKENIKINYKSLYDYLYSRSFDYLPKLIDYDESKIILEYVEDIKTDNELKALDMIRIVSLLHSKTSYYKKVEKSKYNELYNKLNNNISYLTNYYNNLFDEYIKDKSLLPSHLLLLKNYSVINWSLVYSKKILDNWFNDIKDSNKERVCLIHNNLKLDHFIKNKKEYLISWDNYKCDSPIIDLYKLFINENENISFINVLEKYQEEFKLNSDELNLLCLLITIPNKVELDNNEYDNCYKIRKLLNYLNKSFNIVTTAIKV